MHHELASNPQPQDQMMLPSALPRCTTMAWFLSSAIELQQLVTRLWVQIQLWPNIFYIFEFFIILDIAKMVPRFV